MTEQKKIGTVCEVLWGKRNVLTLKAVVNCASALSIQFTEIQYRPWDMKQAKKLRIEHYTCEFLNKTGTYNIIILLYTIVIYY